MEMTNKGRAADLEAIKKISPKIYKQVVDEGIHGGLDDEGLHLLKVRMTIWKNKVEGK